MPLPELLQQSALPVLMCWWPTVAARVEEAQQLMGATRVRAPGVLIPLRGLKFFSMIVGNVQVRFQRLPPLAMCLATDAAFSDPVAHLRQHACHG